MESGKRKIWVYQPLQLWLLTGLLLVLLLLSGYLLFDRGKQFAGTELQRLTARGKQDAQQIAALQIDNDRLQQQIATLQRSSQIDRQASIEVRNEMAQLQDELLGVREELAFYRGIVSPGDAKAGLRIQAFHLEPGETEGAYSFALTVAQVQGNHGYVRGSIELVVNGSEKGKARTLSFKALSGKSELKFKFRYFQKLEGQLDLPAGFRPENVYVRIKPSGRSKVKALEQTFDWPA